MYLCTMYHICTRKYYTCMNMYEYVVQYIIEIVQVNFDCPLYEQ